MDEIKPTPEDFKPTTRFYNGCPYWLKEEMLDRKDMPAPFPKPAYVEIGFLSPGGEMKSFRYYLMDMRRALCLEDFAQAVRFTEDRYMMVIPKSGIIRDVINNLQSVDLSRIRQFIRKGGKKRDASTK